MTLRLVSVAEAVLAIEEMARDPESAHAAEDALYRDVLRAIASGECTNPRLLASAALESQEVSFPRWCA